MRGSTITIGSRGFVGQRQATKTDVRLKSDKKVVKSKVVNGELSERYRNNTQLAGGVGSK